MIKLIKDGVSNHGSRHRQATRDAWRLWSVCCPPILQPFGAAPIYPGYKNPSTGNGKFIICHASKMINMVLQNFLIKNGGFENVQIKNGYSRIKTSDLSRNRHLPDFPAINLVSSNVAVEPHIHWGFTGKITLSIMILWFNYITIN